MDLSSILIMSCVIAFKNLCVLKTTLHPLVLVLVEQVDVHVLFDFNFYVFAITYNDIVIGQKRCF